MASGFDNVKAHAAQIKSTQPLTVKKGGSDGAAKAQVVLPMVCHKEVPVQPQSKRFVGGRNPL